MEPKYANVKVRLAGEDGNAFVILGKVTKAMKNAGIAQEEIDAFREEATAGDYDHLLQTCLAWVDVE
jgi:hypothetical protein